MRLSLAVTLLDDLTGTPVTGSNARAWIEGAKPPIKKDNGVYLFIDLPQGSCTVNAEGGTYSPSKAECVITSDTAESITIRLRPNAQYPTPPGCIRIDGICAPGAEAIVCRTDKSMAYKLLSDVSSGTSAVGIYHPDGVNIEGKLLKMISSDGRSCFVRIKALTDRESSEYSIYGEMPESFPKVGTILTEASEAAADEKGRFTVLLKSSPKGRSYITCEIPESGLSKTIELIESSHISVDMTDTPKGD